MWTVAHWLGLQRLKLELRWIALAAAWPHAWPDTFSFGRLLLTALTAWIVDRSAKHTGECKTWGTSTVAAPTSYRWSKASLAVCAHGTISTPVT